LAPIDLPQIDRTVDTLELPLGSVMSGGIDELSNHTIVHPPNLDIVGIIDPDNVDRAIVQEVPDPGNLPLGAHVADRYLSADPGLAKKSQRRLANFYFQPAVDSFLQWNRRPRRCQRTLIRTRKQPAKEGGDKPHP
jgi:hypothetical protein